MTEVKEDVVNKVEETEELNSPVENDEKQTNDKVTVIMRATGNTPSLKKKKWTVPRDRKVGPIIEFMRKLLRIKDDDSLFLYINQSFAPSPDQTIENLYSCFGINDTLVIHYCLSQAWG